MNQTPISIFDLLMADLNAVAAGKTGETAKPSGESAEMFGHIFGVYLMQQNHSQSAAAGILGAPAADLNSPAASDAAAKFAEDVVSMLPQQTVTSKMTDALSVIPAELEEGTYDILASKIQDGVVNLTIASKENPGQLINVTLPADMLTGSPLGADRIALDAANEQARLETLFAKLNLKEIEVKTADTRQQPTNAAEPIKISLFAETSAGEIVLRGQLNRNRIKAFALSEHRENLANAETAAAVRTAVQKGVPNYLTGEGQILSGNARGETNLGMRTLIAEPDLFEKFLSDGKAEGSKNADNLQNTFNFEINQTGSEEVSSRTEARALRITLPDDIRTSLKPNGRAITISIEPEDLGPARLSLSLVNDKLKARIVVDSVPAKTALENNIDRLVSQLSKADISVDQIEIALNGDSAQNQFFGRQPHWRHRVTSRPLALDGIELDETAVDAIASTPAASQWVSAAGVNVLA